MSAKARPPAALTELLEQLAVRIPDDVLLWRGPDLSGSDVDLLVTARGEAPLVEMMNERGARPSAGDPGHVVWSVPGMPPIDVLREQAWPGHYPSLEGVLARRERAGSLPLTSSPADLALILAAELIMGKPVEKVARRAEPAVEAAGPELQEVARAEGLGPLADLIARPAELRVRQRRGRLSYPRAGVVALRCAGARRALAQRVTGRFGLSRGSSRSGGRGHSGALLITLSGMDGAGKSTAAQALKEALEIVGRPTEIAWARLGSESRLLDGIATPVKRLLRRSGTVADPVAAGGPAVGKRRDPREAGGRRRPVSWVWIVVVALANAHSYRRAAGSHRRAGVALVCDRWATDALVDLQLRYGKHALARAILRCLPPRPDLQVVLELDAPAAAARKPGDQAEWVLAEMERLYRVEARAAGAQLIDASLSPSEVAETLTALVTGLYAP